VSGTGAPYVGLDYFLEEDAGLFFGRDGERKRIIGNLRASRLTLLYAESGVGKSSLLRAGVSARLRQVAAQRVTEPDELDDPGDHVVVPARCLPVVFSAWQGNAKAGLIDALEAAARPLLRDPGTLRLRRGTLEEAIEDIVETVEAIPLVILDQFEEHFLYTTDDGFDDELADCINRRDLRAHFLISVREDAYPQIGPRFKSRIPNVYGNYLHLDFLDEQAGRDAVVEPVKAFNRELPSDAPRFEVETALVDAVLEQVRQGRVTIGESGLPDVDATGPARVETAYLQLVMKRLWDEELQLGSHELRLETLQRLGGADTIVHRHLDDAMDKLPPDQRDAAAAAFRFLVTSSGRKIALSSQELSEFSGVPAAPMEPALAHLERQRILRPIPPAEPGGVARHEIYHDVLAPAILAWHLRHETHREALELAARTRAAARRRWLRRLRLAGLVVGSVVVAVITGIVLHQSREAAEQRRIATSRELAATSRTQLDTDPELGVLLAGEALRQKRTDEAGGALRAALAADRSLGVLLAGSEVVRDVDATPDGNRLLAFGDDGHVRVWRLEDHQRLLDVPASTSAVNDARFSPDGRRIVSAGGDGRIVVWDAGDGRPLLTLRRRGPAATRARWAPDGHRVLAATARDVTVWSASTGRRLQTLHSPRGAFQTAKWQPHARAHILTAGDDGTVRLWDVASGRIVASVDTGSPLRDAVFNDSGTAVVTIGARYSAATVWNPKTRRTVALRAPAALDAPLFDATFDHSGERVATASVDHVRIWDARTGTTGAILTGHGSYVTAIEFSPDDSTVATASNDRSARTWDAATGDQLSVLRGHDSWISGLSYPTAGLIATAGADGDVRLWQTEEAQLAVLKLRRLPDTAGFSHDGDLVVTATEGGVEIMPWRPRDGRRAVFIPVTGGANTASLSPDGRRVVVGMAHDGRPSAPARILRVPDGRRSGPALAVAGPRNGAVTAAFSPDGRLILTAHRDGAARLWSSESHRLLRRLGPVAAPSPRATLIDAQFSPGGRRVATVGVTGVARLFDTASGRQLKAFAVPEGKLDALQLNAVAVQPGGELLATAGEDGRALLWDVQTGKPRPLQHDDGVRSVAFSPDGAVVATASWDRTARLWDARSAQPLGILKRVAEPVASVEFTPDGRRLMTADETNRVRVFACEVCGSLADLQRSARERVTRRLTRDERIAYLADGDG
jgi:WD40 repeat protein